MDTKIQFIMPLLRRFCTDVVCHLQYYRYDPSKPSKTNFLELDLDAQQAWIEANVPDYQFNLYGDNYLGCSYELNEDTLEEYIKYRDDYGVSGIISSQLPNLTKERLEAIRFGAVYALYIGEDIGQGGAIFKLEAVFRRKSIANQALDYRPRITLNSVF